MDYRVNKSQKLQPRHALSLEGWGGGTPSGPCWCESVRPHFALPPRGKIGAGYLSSGSGFVGVTEALLGLALGFAACVAGGALSFG